MLVLQLSILVIPFMIFQPQTFNELISPNGRNDHINMFSLAKNCTQEATKPNEKITVKLVLDILDGHVNTFIINDKFIHLYRAN